MNEPVWINEDVAEAVHSMQLNEHGGGSGVRDAKLLSSALSRDQQKFSYDINTTLFDLAAAYSFGIAKNHPFVDGNKRTAFTVGALFLELNGYRLEASEVDATITVVGVASGDVSEADLSGWFEEHSVDL